ncbi:MAG TPA: vWA domain-containing protein [bacterium]|nr:vWA domain-containing protein [bacterium]
MLEIGTRDIIAIALAAVVATLVSFVLYRRTSPTVPLKLRLLLGTLRWLAAFLLLVIVLDPSWRLVVTRSAPPEVSVLIDDSKSMAYPDSRAKWDQVKTSLSADLVDALEAKARLRFFTFSDTTGEIPFEAVKTLVANGARTDLAAGIARVLKSTGTKPSAMVLASDGGVNFGEDVLHAAAGLKIPIYAISVAGEAQTPDISIDKIETSEAAYAGSDTPVAIYLSGRRPTPVTTSLAISDSTGEVFRTTLTIPGNGARQKTTATIRAGDVGLHSFKATLAPFDGEAVVANNSMAFSLKVMKGKIRVLLVAPGPSWDFAFVRRALQADPAMELAVVFKPGSALALKLPGATNDLGRAIADCDVAIVLRGAALGPNGENLDKFVWNGGGVLLVSPDASGDVPAALNPLEVTRPSRSGPERPASLYSPLLAEAGAGHEILDVDVARSGSIWSSLPPVPVDPSIGGAKGEANILVAGAANSAALPGEQPGKGGSAAPSGGAAGKPLVVAMRHGMGRVVAFSAYDLWRWDLVPRGFGAQASAMSELVTSSVRWLVGGGEAKRLALTTAKSDYLLGEPVALSARVIDENLKPQVGAAVETKVLDRSRGKTVLTAAMVEKSSGNYSFVADLLPAGTYTAEAAATLGGKPYAQDAARFAVSERGLEDADFDGDPSLLEELARQTGGKVYSAPDARKLLNDLNLASVVVKSSRDMRVRLTVGTFVVLACLLAVEWFIRRSRMLA